MEKYINKDLSKIKSIKINTLRGVYFLYMDDELVYIGQSKNIPNRITNHLQENSKNFNSYKTIIVDESQELTPIEDFYIRKYKPKYNKANAIEAPYQKSTKKPQILKYSTYYKSPKITMNILIENINL